MQNHWYYKILRKAKVKLYYFVKLVIEQAYLMVNLLFGETLVQLKNRIGCPNFQQNLGTGQGNKDLLKNMNLLRRGLIWLLSGEIKLDEKKFLKENPWYKKWDRFYRYLEKKGQRFVQIHTVYEPTKTKKGQVCVYGTGDEKIVKDAVERIFGKRYEVHFG